MQRILGKNSVLVSYNSLSGINDWILWKCVTRKKSYAVQYAHGHCKKQNIQQFTVFNLSICQKVLPRHHGACIMYESAGAGLNLDINYSPNCKISYLFRPYILEYKFNMLFTQCIVRQPVSDALSLKMSLNQNWEQYTLDSKLI